MSDPLRPPRVEQMPAQVGRSHPESSLRKPNGASPPPAGRKGPRLWPLVITLVIFGVIAVPVYFLLPVIRDSVSQYSLRTEGIPAYAEILSVSETNIRVENRPLIELQLRVHPTDAPPYETSVRQPFSMLHAVNLRPGMGVQLKFDAKNPSSVLITSTGVAAPTTPTRSMQTTASPAQKRPSPDPVIEDTVSTVARVCRDAKDCCLLVAGDQAGSSCVSFLNPHIPETACTSALDSFTRAAESLGKSCTTD